jgi:hypothetical protein
MINLYKEILPVLERAFSILESKIKKPTFIKRGSYHVFRYADKSVEAAIIQKLARIISGLNASLSLLSGGFVQELGALFRTLDEFNEDIIFLCQVIQSSQVSEFHQKHLDSFYKEELDQPDNAFESTQKRHPTPRKKIQAAISNMPESELNPSDHKKVLRTISKAYSGYVHGASCHIMEMYGGNPPHYHISGMLGTPRIVESIKDSWNYFYRGLLSVMFAAKAFKEDDLLKELSVFRDYVEKKSGKTEWEKPEKIMKEIKRKKA